MTGTCVALGLHRVPVRLRFSVCLESVPPALPPLAVVDVLRVVVAQADMIELDVVSKLVPMLTVENNVRLAFESLLLYLVD